MSQSASYKRWYEKRGKTQLAEKRRRDYWSDPAVREKVISRSRNYRKKRREEVPESYITYADAADALGVTTVHLTRWRDRCWYPEPKVLNGRYYFTRKQVNLLVPLAEFLMERRRKLTIMERSIRQKLTEYIYVNWL